MDGALARCVGDVERFLAEHWSRAPLHRPGVDPDGFVDLFSLDDVDTFIASSLPRVPALRLVRDGKPLDQAAYTRTVRIGGRTVAGVADAGRVFDEFAAGATIVLQTLHRHWAPLARFCRQLELELHHPVQTNAYLTPAGAQGLAVHHDTHDVFVLQLAGEKHWDVFEPAVDLPLPGQKWRAGDHRPGAQVLSVDLAPGDLLYLPRGFAHSATSQAELSVHLTVGILLTTWADIARDVLASVSDDVAFRQALPVGYAADPTFGDTMAGFLDRLGKHLAGLDPAPLAERAVRRFWSTRPPVLAGQLRQLTLARRLDDGSRVRRRPASTCHFWIDGLDAGEAGDGVRPGGELVVLLGDRQLRMPAALEPVLARIVTGEAFEVRHLRDLLDRESRLVLVRRLVREGLLEVIEETGDVRSLPARPR